MADSIAIHDLKCIERDGWQELSAEVDGERLWFQVPNDVDLFPRAEPFVAAALLEAMYTGASIEVEAGLPLSPLLHENLAELQAVYHCWNHELKPINIEATLEEAESNTGVVASCYSGGVDSGLTFARRRKQIDTLVLVLGFDVEGEDDVWSERIARHQRFADASGKNLIPIKTNAREFCVSRKICWNFGHGLFLASLAPMLGFKVLYVPSSHTYDQLEPWGSHPLTDPMWSTAVNTIVHCGGGYSRANKVRALCSEQLVLDNIQVCRRSNSHNCGACPKCVRTMLAFYLLDAHSAMLPELDDLKLLEWLKPRSSDDTLILEHAMILAKECENEAVFKQLRSYYKRYQLSELLPLLDRMLLGGFARRLYRAARKPAWLDERVLLHAKDGNGF